MGKWRQGNTSLLQFESGNIFAPRCQLERTSPKTPEEAVETEVKNMKKMEVNPFSSEENSSLLKKSLKLKGITTSWNLKQLENKLLLVKPRFSERFKKIAIN